MENMIEALSSLTDAIKNLQLKILKIEHSLKAYAKKEDIHLLKNKLRTSISELNLELKDLDSKISKLKEETISQISELENSLVILKNRISDVATTKEVAEVNYKILELRDKIEKIEIYEKKYKEISKNILQLYSKLNKLERSLKSLFKTKKDLEKLKKDIELNKTLIEEIYEKFENIEFKLASFENSFNDIFNTFYELEEKMEVEINNKLKNYEETVNHLLKTLEDKIQELPSIKLSNKDIEKLRKIPSDFGDIYEKILNLESKLGILDNIYEKLQKDLIYLKKKLAEKDTFDTRILIKKIDTLTSEIKVMSKKIKEMEDTINDLREITYINTKNLEKIESKVLNLETKIKLNNIEDIYTFSEKIKILENNIEKLKIAIANLYNLNRSTPKILYSENSELEGLKNKVNELEEAIKKLYLVQNKYLLDIYKKLEKLESAL